MKQIKYILLITLLAFTSCATLNETYQGKSTKTVKINIKFHEDKGEWFELTSHHIPAAKLMGSYEQKNTGETFFYIEKIILLCSWFNGWTHGEFEASGSFKLINRDSGFSFSMVDQIEFWDIIKGEIRYNDDYYRNEDGLRKVKYRIERFQEFVQFLKKQELLPFYPNSHRGIVLNKKFKQDITHLAFPEIYGYRRLEKKQWLHDKY